MYDTHCHPYLAGKKSQEHILENFFWNGWNYLNSVACDIESSKTSISIAQKYSWAYASIGIHPTHTCQYRNALPDTLQILENIYNINKEHIIAIWEIGLDYHWLSKLSEEHNMTEQEITDLQKDFFRAQIQLAKKLKLPIIIHNRNTSEDIYEILVQENYKNFVFHCYSENLEYAQKLLYFAPNCMLGFGGITTFKSAKETQDTVKNIPLKNIIIETDSPYLTPTPLRWKEENEPLFTKYVLSHIIDLRDESAEEITDTIFKNSTRFFNIPL